MSGVLDGHINANQGAQELSIRQIVRDPFAVVSLPSKAATIKSSTLLKLCPGNRVPWQKRTVCFTKDWLGICTVGEQMVAEIIPLHEIISVEVVSEQERNSDLPILPSSTPRQSLPSTPKGEPSLARSPSSAARLIRAVSMRKKESLTPSSIFQIKTVADGRNFGRTFWFNCEDTDVDQWVEKLQTEFTAAKKRNSNMGLSGAEKFKKMMLYLFNSTPFQVIFGLLIACNFVVNVGEAQAGHNMSDETRDVFFALDVSFTVVFAIELIWNMYVHDLRNFFLDGWNVFDFVIVIFSILSLAFDGIPVVSNLRLLRVFRTVRLFKKLTSLRIIFNSILGSIIPVLNSVFILIIVTAMYAIIAVQLYGGRFPSKEEDFFQNFQHSIFTMYQVATGDSWASGVARPLFTKINENGEEEDDLTVMPFFVSYTILSAMILLNVVVAVLLDNFTRCVAQEEKIQRQDRAAAKRVQMEKACKTLDPLMKDLSKFENNQHLNEMIQLLFDAIDMNQNHSLSFEELRAGLKSLNTEFPMLLSSDDFDAITRMGELSGPDGAVTAHNFRNIVRDQLDKYTSRVLAEALHEFDTGSETFVELMALKLILAMRTPGWQTPGVISKESIASHEMVKNATANHSPLSVRSIYDAQGQPKAASRTLPESVQRLQGVERAPRHSVDEVSSTHSHGADASREAEFSPMKDLPSNHANPFGQAGRLNPDSLEANIINQAPGVWPIRSSALLTPRALSLFLQTPGIARTSSVASGSVTGPDLSNDKPPLPSQSDAHGIATVPGTLDPSRSVSNPGMHSRPPSNAPAAERVPSQAAMHPPHGGPHRSASSYMSMISQFNGYCGGRELLGYPSLLTLDLNLEPIPAAAPKPG